MALAVLALTVFLALLAMWGRPVVTLGALAAAWTLLPGGILLPGPLDALPNAVRLIEVAAVLGLVRAPRRDAPPRPLPAAVPLLLAFVGIAAVTGVAQVDPRIDVGVATSNWIALAEQVVVLVLVLALARRTTAMQAAVITAAAVGTSGVIAVLERLSGSSYARALFRASPSQLQSVAAQPLERRGGVRVRGAFEFALAYGWVVTAALPVAVVAALLVRSRYGRNAALLVAATVPLGAAGVVLSRGRSPLLAMLVIGAVLLLVLRPESPVQRVLGLGGGILSLGLLGPEVVRRLAPSVDQGSIDARFDRLPDALDLVARNPLHGVGLGAISKLGPETLDSSFFTVYVDAGAVAITVLLLALAAALVGTARAIPRRFREDDPDGLLVLGTSLSLLALLVGSIAFDAFTLPSSARWTWVLAAIGLAAAERRVGPARLPALRVGGVLLRLVGVLAAIAIGVLVRDAAPTHATAGMIIGTVDPRLELAYQPYDTAVSLADTACQLSREVSVGQPWHVDRCEDAEPYGWVRVFVTADDPAHTREGLDRISTQLRDLPVFGSLGLAPPARYDLSDPVVGIPNAARTAPVYLGLIAGAAALLVPGRRRRRVTEEPEPARVPAAV